MLKAIIMYGDVDVSRHRNARGLRMPYAAIPIPDMVEELQCLLAQVPAGG